MIITLPNMQDIYYKRQELTIQICTYAGQKSDLIEASALTSSVVTCTHRDGEYSTYILITKNMRIYANIKL